MAAGRGSATGVQQREKPRRRADSVGILSHTYAGVKPHSQARGASTCCGCGLEKPSTGLQVFLSSEQEEMAELSKYNGIYPCLSSREDRCRWPAQGIEG